MSKQEQKQKQPSAPAEQEEVVEAKDMIDEELNEATEDLLADIDDILEQNAEEFVKSYVQKGGE